MEADITIIGAGAVGLAIASELAYRFPQYTIIVLERHDSFGRETSSRNSEVIHSGIYYPKDSLKAKLCVEGNPLLYDFCEKAGVNYQQIGKLIIARSTNELEELHNLLEFGKANGVPGIELIGPKRLNAMEPEVNAVGAILSKTTGIIDSHVFMGNLEALGKAKGVIYAYKHEVVGIDYLSNSYKIAYKSPDEKINSLSTTWLINCAGLGSDYIAEVLGINLEANGYKIHPCKGEYFALANAKAKRVNHLIYPPPLKNLKGLGIHLTKSLDGRVRFGPNAIYVHKLEYSVDANHVEEFYEGVKSYLPFLDKDDLSPDMAGIRPKIQGPHDIWQDFVIKHEEEKGFSGFINLIGIESPGLTSSLSIAKYVGELIS